MSLVLADRNNSVIWRDLSWYKWILAADVEPRTRKTTWRLMRTTTLSLNQVFKIQCIFQNPCYKSWWYKILVGWIFQKPFTNDNEVCTYSIGDTIYSCLACRCVVCISRKISDMGFYKLIHFLCNPTFLYPSRVIEIFESKPANHRQSPGEQVE